MKTNKHQTLLFIQKKGAVRAHDLVRQFDYSPGTSRSYLSYLMRQNLLERTAHGHVLTDTGQNRLQFFEVMGCGNPGCPLCEAKKAEHFTCPTCRWQLPKKKARIGPAWSPPFFRWENGVYCPNPFILCYERIFTEKQAQLMGIPEAMK
jgi:hypothetical protein